MLKSIRQEAVVQPGGIIELAPTDLPVGTAVEVIVLLNEESALPSAEPEKDEKWVRFYETVVGAWKDDPEINQIFQEIDRARHLANRKEFASLSSEADLLQSINQGLSADTQQRYDALQSKLRSQTITPEEHQELLSLVGVVERSEAERLQHLIALSHLRKVSLDDLLKQLEIPQPPIHV
jgi:hypothetical protein